MPAPPTIIGIPADLAGLDEALAQAPDSPAVFLIHAREGAPYLGRTALLRRRLKRLLGQREGASRLLNLRAVASRIEYWLTGSQLESTLVFYQLARQYFREDYLKIARLRMPPYVKLILTNPFPRSQVTTRLSAGRDSLYFGPFPTRQAADEFESGVLDLFQIRRCQEDIVPSPDHPGCIYGEMNMCLRPCQQAVSREEYLAEVSRAGSFLQTRGRSLSDPVSAARNRFSDELNFEEAARQHKRLQQIEQVVRAGGELARDIGNLNAVAITRSVDPAAVELWFMCQGCWQEPVRFGFEIMEGKTVSMDLRLREIITGLSPGKLPPAERQEHLAILARWFYSTWRDGEFLLFDDLEHPPYRKLVNAISRVAHSAQKA